MAEMTIELRRDPQTGKHDIIVNLASDADSLPHEHEQQHRNLVEKLLGKGSVGKVIVQREGSAEATPAAATPEAERQAVAGSQ